MLNWVKTSEQSPEQESHPDGYRTSGDTLGWWEDMGYQITRFEWGQHIGGTGPSIWERWVIEGEEGDWYEVPAPEYWAELNPPR